MKIIIIIKMYKISSPQKEKNKIQKNEKAITTITIQSNQ